MAVTTANTIKLSDVCLEIYGSSSTSGRTLAGCHAAANPSGFNGTYAVSGDTLLDFRGYSHITIPGTPTGLTETADTYTTITMSWNAVSGADGYDVSMNDGSVIDVGNNTSHTRTGLVCDATSYNFKVRAYNAAGNGSYTSNVAMATEADNTAPSVPTNFAAAQNTDTYITLTWSASTDDCSGMSQYNIHRNVNGGAYSNLKSVSSGIGTTTDTPPTIGDTYGYKVRALDQAGNYSAFSAADTEVFVDNEPPTGGSITATEDIGHIDVSWTAASDNVAVTDQILWVSVNSGSYSTVGGPKPVGAGSEVYSSVSDGNTYRFRMSYYDDENNVRHVYSSTITYDDTVAPSVPGTLTLSNPSVVGIDVSWGASTDSDSGISHYELSHGTTSTPTNAANVGNVTSYTRNGLSSGTRYYFRVRAEDNAGNTSGYGNTANLYTLSSAPVLSFGTITSSGIVVNRTTVTAASYKLERSLNGVSGWTTVTSNMLSSQNDSSLSSGTRYYYRATSYNSQVYGPYSSTVNTYTLCAAPTLSVENINETSIELTWGAVTGANLYDLEYKESSSGTWLNASDNTSPSEVTGLTGGTSYDFRVRARNQNNVWGSYSSTVTETTNSGVTYTDFNISPFPTSSCSNSSWTVRYHDGSNAYPVSGDTIYTDDQGTVWTGGASQTWNSITLPSYTNRANIQVTSGGLVTSRTTC